MAVAAESLPDRLMVPDTPVPKPRQMTARPAPPAAPVPPAARWMLRPSEVTFPPGPPPVPRRSVGRPRSVVPETTRLSSGKEMFLPTVVTAGRVWSRGLPSMKSCPAWMPSQPRALPT